MSNKHTQVVDFSNPNADKITSASTQTPMLDRLKAHLDSITPEEFANEMDEVAEWFQSDASAYVEQYNHEEKIMKERAIDFAKWLAKEWMSIWVEDKWLWEWQPERTPETIHMHLKYYTEEELYELYLEENQ